MESLNEESVPSQLPDTIECVVLRREKRFILVSIAVHNTREMSIHDCCFCYSHAA